MSIQLENWQKDGIIHISVQTEFIYVKKNNDGRADDQIQLRAIYYVSAPEITVFIALTDNWMSSEKNLSQTSIQTRLHSELKWILRARWMEK